MANTCEDLKPLELDKWSSCDGKKYNDEEIKTLLYSAIIEERYEFAAECRDELKRRGITY